MPRVTNAQATRRRRKRVLKQTSGFFGNKSRLFRYANDALQRAGQFAYRDRRKKKSEFRALWITRINAVCRAHDLKYSHFMGALKKLSCEMNRKVLSELALHRPEAFLQLIEKVKAQLKLAA